MADHPGFRLEESGRWVCLACGNTAGWVGTFVYCDCGNRTNDTVAQPDPPK